MSDNGLTQERAKVARLRKDSGLLIGTVKHYKNTYEHAGSGDPMTGRAWMLMTRAVTKMEDTLASLDAQSERDAAVLMAARKMVAAEDETGVRWGSYKHSEDAQSDSCVDAAAAYEELRQAVRGDKNATS